MKREDIEEAIKLSRNETCSVCNYFDDGELAEALHNLYKAEMERVLEEIFQNAKTNKCEHPTMNDFGDPVCRCGGCWGCVVDQVLEKIKPSFDQAIQTHCKE